MTYKFGITDYQIKQTVRYPRTAITKQKFILNVHEMRVSDILVTMKTEFNNNITPERFKFARHGV